MAYLGENYRGLAVQENVPDTVEAMLFNALQKTCLITDTKTCHYSRCGRTDKGVSAWGQVVAVHMRSNLKEGVEFVATEKDAPSASTTADQLPLSDCTVSQNTLSASPTSPIASAATTCSSSTITTASCSSSSSPSSSLSTASGNPNARELDYVQMLNRVLPFDIRVLAWAPVDADFSARFSCAGRVYKYFFLKRDLDIDRMREASQLLVGEHDFRNFCKMDVVHVSNFVREIRDFTIEPCSPHNCDQPTSLWVATISGTAFLYHQIRCMMQILFEVGARLEECDVVKTMLDVEVTKNKPQYPLASEVGLVLWDCQFPSLQWSSTVEAQRLLMAKLLEVYEDRIIKSTMVGAMRAHLQTEMLFSSLHSSGRTAHNVRWKDMEEPPQKRKYVPLMQRDTEPHFEQRVESLSESKKLKRDSNLKKGGEMRR
uniref:tRNA pseudouridine synthase n=1 Tax=Eutreptiella gymnastica TaxID=73025 RepID=A0A7S4GGL5_9EUGL